MWFPLFWFVTRVCFTFYRFMTFNYRLTTVAFIYLNMCDPFELHFFVRFEMIQKRLAIRAFINIITIMTISIVINTYYYNFMVIYAQKEIISTGKSSIGTQASTWLSCPVGHAPLTLKFVTYCCFNKHVLRFRLKCETLLLCLSLMQWLLDLYIKFILNV